MDDKKIETYDSEKSLNQKDISIFNSEIAGEISEIINNESVLSELNESEDVMSQKDSENLDSCDMFSTAEISFKFEEKKRKRQIARYSTLLLALMSAIIVFSLLTENFPLYAKVLAVIGSVVVTGFSFYFLFSNKQKLLKLFFILIICMAAFSVVYFILVFNGWLEILLNKEVLQQKINDYGDFAVPLFIVLQFLQAIILPIPSSVTTFVGTKLFGGFLGSIYSLIGIIPASIIAFFIGRYAGYRLVMWIVGKDSLEKTLLMVKGRDKVVLTLMFFLPLFPDDVLCFVAGFSTMSVLYFVVMLSISRAIQVFTTSFFLGEGLIPLNTWWGIMTWILIAIAVVWLFYYCIKKGDKIEKFFITKVFKKEYQESSGYIDKLLNMIEKYDASKKEKQIEKLKKQYRKRLEKKEIKKC